MLELFYSTNPDSAEAVRFVNENGLASRVRLRHVSDDKDAQADFQANGGERWPAIYDGEHLVDGRAAVIAILSGLGDDA